MPSLLHRLHHKHSTSSSASTSPPSSPKLETLSLSSTTPSSSSSAAPTTLSSSSSASAPTSSSSGAPLKSILRTSTVSSSGSSLFDGESKDGRASGASTPRTSVVGSSSGASGKGRSMSMDMDLGDEAVGCKGLQEQGKNSCYAILAFSRTNVLQFINLPVQLHVPILEAIRSAWEKGVSNHGTPKTGGGKLGEDTLVDVWEVHLSGMVWGSRGTRASVAVRRLISQLLSTLAQNQYILAGAIDASFKDSSKDTLYLKRVHRPPSSMPTQFLSMSFQDEDKIWLIDAPRAVIESVEEAVGYSWSKGISKSGPLRKDEGCWEITVRGSPWASHSSSSQIASRLLHLHLLRAVYVQGFQIKGSISLADKDEGEMDSLFFESRVEGDD